MEWMRPVLVAAATVAVVALVGLASRWMRRRPTPAVGGGVRLPIVIALLGWLIVVAGALMALVAFGLDEADDPVPMRIASVAMVLGGLGIVVLHRNWRLAVLDDRVYQRTALGRVRCVVYDDIVASSLRSHRGVPLLEVRGSDGDRVAVNPASFDVRPVLQAIAARGYRGHVGERWS